MTKQVKRPNQKPRRSVRKAKVQRALPLTYVTPAAKRVHLVFPLQGTVSEAAAGTGGVHFYRLNSVYDVDTALGSTTTPGFNEWANFFTSYRVRRTRVHLEGTVYGAAIPPQAIATVCMVPNAYTSTIPANASTWPVQPMAVSKVLTPASNGGANRVTFDMTYQMHKLARLTQRQFDSDFDFTATTAGNPARQLYLGVTVQSYGAGIVTTFNYQIPIHGGGVL